MNSVLPTGANARTRTKGMRDMEKKTQEPKVEWWISSHDVCRAGPFKFQVDAWEALRLAPSLCKQGGSAHVPGAHAWPERVLKQCPQFPTCTSPKKEEDNG